jgi:pectate lyase
VSAPGKPTVKMIRILALAAGVTALATVVQAASDNLPADSPIGYASIESGTTGGKVGKTITVSSAGEFRNAAGSAEPLNILVSGPLDLGRDSVKVAANKTIIGQCADAGFLGHVYLHGVSNIILRNLNSANPGRAGQGIGGGDGMTAHSTHHVWVDHCSFGECADGQFDITHGSDFFTVSWCKFSYTNEASDHRLSMLIGNKDNLGDEDAGKLHVTLHHNWIGDLVQDRAPRVRFGQVHIFNNYYAAKGNNICIGLGVSCQVLLESSYFDGIKRPWKSRSEDGPKAGRLQCNHDMIYTFGPKIQMGKTAPVDFKPPYAYRLDAAGAVKDLVMNNAGVGKGPFAPKQPTQLRE